MKIKTALVTGATSGIGRATALMLARRGYNIAITGRRLPLLQELCNEIEKTSGVESYILNFDIRDKHEVFDSYDMLPETWKKHLKILVNNAGLALGDDSFEMCDDEEWDQMIDTNVKGLLYMSQLVSNSMKENGEGHIINISSVAGRHVYYGGNVYCATKHAVDAITQSMRIDLLKYGIKVSSVAPGMVNTEFSTVRYRGDVERARKVYKGVKPLSADDIASAIEFIITRPEHVCINDMLIMPTQQAMPYYVDREE
ncbi:MAG: SDR family NAD(P)-dependent oxidoreductase [Marinilabiliaceae bacterium]|nr:SDR family NAD(P)-dependent oxidoreductase [Marinilabiliaceae bacterium]